MAIKERNNDQTKKNRIIEVLTTDYKWENLLLAILAFICIALAGLILTGVLSVSESFPLIGKYPKVFAWCVLAIAVIGLLLVFIPFMSPSFPEIKRITWPTKKSFLEDTIRTFFFIVFVALIFLFFDAFITAFLGKIDIL